MTTLSTSSPTLHPLLWPVMATLLVIGWSSGFVDATKRERLGETH